TIEALQADLGDGPGELEAVEERLFAIRALARKHQAPPHTLAELAEDLRIRLWGIDAAAGPIDRLAAALAEAEGAYAAAAARLGAARREAAGRLDARMAEELPPLKLGRAVFVTEVTAAEPGPQGSERVRFTAAINPGA